MQNLYNEVAARIDQALRQVDETRQVVIGEKNLAQSVSIFKESFPGKSAVLIADQNTFQAAGNAVQEAFRADTQIELQEPLLFTEQEFHADRTRTDQVVEHLKKSDAVPVAIGSGTVNDLVKLASHETNRPYMIVATAASMDGYTAYGASIQVDSFKLTRFCPAPFAVLVDMDVICNAPVEMGAAGYADLLAKVPAGADWMLADLIGTEPIDRAAWNIVQPELRSWLAQPDGVPARDRKALLYLIEGLIMSGLAMQKAKSSRTASGAEHLFSHLWDNRNHTHNGKTPSHGFKVGIGTLTTSALYEKLLDVNRDQFKQMHDASIDSLENWNDIEKEIVGAFTDESLRNQVLRESRAKYVEKDEVNRRFQLYWDHWDAFREQIREQVLPAEKIRTMLRECQAPFAPEQLGISAPMLQESCRLAKRIRSRYNILDFAREHGFWDSWIPEVVRNVTTPNS